MGKKRKKSRVPYPPSSRPTWTFSRERASTCMIGVGHCFVWLQVTLLHFLCSIWTRTTRNFVFFLENQPLWLLLGLLLLVWIQDTSCYKRTGCQHPGAAAWSWTGIRWLLSLLPPGLILVTSDWLERPVTARLSGSFSFTLSLKKYLIRLRFFCCCCLFYFPFLRIESSFKRMSALFQFLFVVYPIQTWSK